MGPAVNHDDDDDDDDCAGAGAGAGIPQHNQIPEPKTVFKRNTCMEPEHDFQKRMHPFLPKKCKHVPNTHPLHFQPRS